MRARWALVLAVCAGASAGAAPAPAGQPNSFVSVGCEPLLLTHPSPKPPNVVEWEAAAVHAARAFSELVERGEATEATAATMARMLATTPLGPPPAAVALGAPRLHVGVLYLAEPNTVIVFQQNNSAALQHYWRSLASAWNASAVVWSPAWLSCEDTSWWSSAAAARGAWPVRAAAAIYRRLPAAPCEHAMSKWFGGPPRCDAHTTSCEAWPVSKDDEFTLEYRCRCLQAHWNVHGEGWVPSALLSATDAVHACQPCERAGDAAACLADSYRLVLLGANLAGISMCLVIAIVIFKKRKCKAVAMGMWTVLEVVLLGALLMYASAASQHLPVSQWRCLCGAWLRELGFVACYGSVVLRLWVLLAEFRTRKAHRWTPRDAEVLRVVASMLIGCGCYLAAFTAVAACTDGCSRAAWHHVTAGAELLLLAAGLRIAYAARNANVPFQERGWLCTALLVELACGVAWRGAATLGAAPERAPLAATARAQLSAGAALACVLAPRLWHGYRARSLAQEVSRRGPAEGFGVDGEEEPTSEEVRAELKRLYVQLEILRNKTLRRDNPHISKRRGGRKPPHRRFSLQSRLMESDDEADDGANIIQKMPVHSRLKGIQALQARRGGKGKSGGSTSIVEASDAGDASRTPEDSVCSNEGPSHYTDGDQA